MIFIVFAVSVIHDVYINQRCIDSPQFRRGGNSGAGKKGPGKNGEWRWALTVRDKNVANELVSEHMRFVRIFAGVNCMGGDKP